MDALHKDFKSGLHNYLKSLSKLRSIEHHCISISCSLYPALPKHWNWEMHLWRLLFWLLFEKDDHLSFAIDHHFKFLANSERHQ